MSLRDIEPRWVLQPFPIDNARTEIAIEVWDGSEPPPGPTILNKVELYVLPEFNDSVASLITEMPSLRVIQTLSAGYDHVLPLVPAHVTLCNARGVHDASTAELAVALTLASLRRLPVFHRAQMEESWEPNSYDSLADRTVLILGYGSIGQAVADRMLPFECRILRVARSKKSSTIHAVDELFDLLPIADVVVITLPLTNHTRGMVDDEFLAAMKDGAVLVNVARGAIVETDALVEHTSAGRLSAALDVVDPEPLPRGHALWRIPSVIITPHVGGNSTAFPPRITAFLKEQLERFANGEKLLNTVRQSDSLTA